MIEHSQRYEPTTLLFQFRAIYHVSPGHSSISYCGLLVTYLLTLVLIDGEGPIPGTRENALKQPLPTFMTFWKNVLW